MSSQSVSPTNLLFLKSAFCLEGAFMSTDDIVQWLAEQNQKVTVNVGLARYVKSKVGTTMKLWAVFSMIQEIFSIDGISVCTNWNGPAEWQQPIINQPEVGFLGIITKEFNGVLHFLLQAKIEPGNIHYVQLSPTLQATRSNYTQVHKGRKPLYLDYFHNAKPSQVLLDQLQSEQGGRFLRKRNRNIIIKIDEDIQVYDQFTWLTLGQIKALMQRNNLLNMDTRTVISGIAYGNYSPAVIGLVDFLARDHELRPIKHAILKSALSPVGAKHSIETIISF